MITLNLPQKGLQVLGADLNCSESIGALPTLLSRPNDSTHDALGERCTAGFQSPLCPLWVINDRRGQAGRSSMSVLPRKRTNDGEPRTSALCQKPTYAVQQTVPLFNYLIGDCEHVGWDAEPSALAVF